MNTGLALLSIGLIVLALSASDIRLVSGSPYMKSGGGISRPARGFRPAALSTARGFGKRTPEAMGSSNMGLGDSNLPELPPNR